jgi:phosphoribosylformimino-5-aminoimidazole carboxamide ribonucleotide (ProFAR) isomerase
MQRKEVDMKNGKLKRLAQGKTGSVEKRLAMPTHLLTRTACATSPPKTTQ